MTAIATNMMMMGYAYQTGLLPLTAQSIEQAIELNGVSIKMNTLAFRLGRLAAAKPEQLAAMMQGTTKPRRQRRWATCRSTRSSLIAPGT